MSGDDFRRHLAFMRGLVRQHRVADDIADGVDMRHIGVLLFVHRDKAAFIDHHSGSFCIDFATIGTATHRHQHAVEKLRSRRVFTFKGNHQAFFSGFDLADFCLQVNRFIAFFNALVQRPHEVAVGTGDQAVSQFHHGYLAAQCVINGGHFQTDNPAADNQHALGHIGQSQRAGGVNQARVVVGEAGNAHHAGTRRDNGVVESDGFAAVFRFNNNAVGRAELAHAIHHLHLALLGQPGKPAGELADYAFFPAADLVDVDFWLAETHTLVLDLFRFGDDFCYMQQRFGRNAADVQAHPAQAVITLDQYHLLAEIGSAEGGGVTAGSGAQYQHFGV